MDERRTDGLPRHARQVRRQDQAAGPGDECNAMETAMERAERIRFRHEKTEYDALIRSGVDRDTAREIIDSRR